VTPFANYLRRIPADFDQQLAAVRQRFGLPAATRPGVAGIEDGAQTLPPDRASAYNSQARALVPDATVSHLVDHIDYIVKRIGIDHVGIGTDFNHGSGIKGFNDESEAPNVTGELLRRGYTGEQIAKIWGGNFLRVFRRVEETAKTLRRG
jgi:membrane dipeptidase